MLAQQEQVLIRATREELARDEDLNNCTRRLLMESALQTGSTPESAEAISKRSVSAIDAAGTGDQILILPEAVQHSLQERIKGVDVDKGLDREGNKDGTPLFFAARKGHVKAVRALVGARADLDKATSDRGATPLHAAARNGHLRCLQILLRRGCNIMLFSTIDYTFQTFSCTDFSLFF